MIKLFKNSKRALSFVLAFAVLAVSLFTGIDFKAEAATESTGIVDTWDNSSGSWYDKVLNDEGETGADWDHAIIIDSAEELAYLAGSAITGSSESGKYYKVADGIKAFNMTPTLLESGVDMSGDMTLDEVEEVLNTTKIDGNYSNTDFLGAGFDGNGVTIYGLQGDNTGNKYGSGGLFNTVAAGVTIKNLTIKNSFFQAANGAGALFGSVKGTGTVTIENVVLTGNVVISSRGGTAGVYGGVMFGYSANRVVINNCLVYNNLAKHAGSFTSNDGSYTKTGYDITYGLFGIVGSITDADSTKVYSSISDSVILDCFPCAARYNWASTNAITYENVYTNMIGKSVTNKENDTAAASSEPTRIDTFTFKQNSSGSFTFAIESTASEENPITYTEPAGSFYEITAEGAKGAVGKAAMTELDWDTVWFATAGMPTLCYAHHSYEEFTYTNISTIDECQKETCAVCGAMAATATAHSYVVGDETSTCSKCGFVCDHTDADHYTYSESGSTYTKVCDCGATVTGAVDIKCVDKTVLEWSGTTDTTLADNEETGADWEHAIIIDSPEELAYLATTSAGESESEGNYYKIADGIKAFNMTPSLNLNGNMTPEEVEAALNKTNLITTWWGKIFKGKGFDGNGVTIYGLQGDNTATPYASGGLFNQVTAGVTIKNLTIKNSFFQAANGAGTLFGSVKGTGTVTIENVVLTGNVVVSSRGGTAGVYGGVMFGYSANRVVINNCLVYNNLAKHAGSFTSNDGSYTKTGYDITYGLFGTVGSITVDSTNVYSSISDSVILDCFPCAARYSWASTGAITYENVYTNMIGKSVTNKENDTAAASSEPTRIDTFTFKQNSSGGFTFAIESTDYENPATYTEPAGSFYEITADGAKGAAGKAAMNELDWGTDWLATSGMPTLREFHDDVFTCIPDPDDNYAGHVTSCSCGAGADTTVVHDYTTTGEGDTAVSTCETCAFVCDHNNADYYKDTLITDGGCLDASVYERECECGATLTVEIAAAGSHTASGNYYISPNTHADICKLCDKTFDVAQHTDEDSDHLCDVCRHTCGDYLFEGASITLTDSIAVNYMVEKSAIDSLISDMYIKFTFCGKDYTVSEYTESGEYYVFTFDKIAPNRMSDVIYATVYGTKDGADYQSATSEYSIKRYCHNILEDTADTDTELRTLLVDLLNYGAESQAYTNEQGDTSYAADEFANAELSNTQKAWGTKGSALTVSDQNLKYAEVVNPTVTWKGAGLYLDEEATLRFTIEADSISDLTVKAVCDDVTIEIPSSKFVKRTDVTQDNRYYVYVRGINVTKMSDTVTLTVYNGDTAVSNTITYSVETYANAKIGGDDAALSDLLIAMIRYGNSAKSYAYKDCTHNLGEGEIMKEAELFVAGIKEYACDCGYDCKESYTTDSIKILSISNSYGEDSFMKMHEMCLAAGFTKIDIAILYRSGCNLEKHWTNMQDPTNADNLYTLDRWCNYGDNNTNGEWYQSATNKENYNVSIETYLNEADWDIIALQQGSSNSGRSNTFGDLDSIISHVSNKCPNATLLWNMTWGWQEGFTYLANAYGSESAMYNSIVGCVKDIIVPKVESGALHSIVPVGTAVTNARTSSLEDTVHRDKSHLSYEFGRYIAALTWFCHITGQSPYDTAFATSNTSLTTEQMNIVLESVENAIKNPYEETQSIYTE